MITDVRKHYRFSADRTEVVAIHDGPGLTCRLACFEPRQALPPETIDPVAATCYVVEGTGIFTIDQRAEYVSAGGLVCLDGAASCRIDNPGPGRLVVMIVACT